MRSGGRIPRWGVVILNWNAPDDTIACIKSVDAAARHVNGIEIHVVVVDNGSLNESVMELELTLKERENWKLVSLDRNLGFSQGMNAGIDALTPVTPESVLLLNNDTLLDERALVALQRCHATQPSNVLGLAIASKGGTPRRWLGGYRYYHWLGAARPVFVDEMSEARHPTVDYVCGSAMLCDMKFLGRIGGVPTNSFLYFEELRLMQALPEGERPRFCPEARVLHREGTSATKLRNPSKHYYAAHACFRFTWDTSAVRLPSVFLARMLRLTYLSVLSISFRPLRDGLLAFADFLRGIERQPQERAAINCNTGSKLE